MQQASYLEGGPLLWILPLYLHVNQKSDDDDDDDDECCMKLENCVCKIRIMPPCKSQCTLLPPILHKTVGAIYYTNSISYNVKKYSE